MIKDINDKLMYKDAATVYREACGEEEDGSTARVRAAVSGLENVPCRLSRSKADSAEQADMANEVKALYVIFADPAYAVRAGDLLLVRHLGEETVLLAGRPTVYQFHQEIPAIEQELA